MSLNDITFWIWVCFWPLWLIWEATLLVMRGEHVNVGLISMIAKDRAYQLNAAPYFWMGLGAHFFGNWTWKTWQTPIPAIAFWAIGVAILACDLALWGNAYQSLPYWVRVCRYPGLVAGVGLLAGFLLFPQKSLYIP